MNNPPADIHHWHPGWNGPTTVHANKLAILNNDSGIAYIPITYSENVCVDDGVCTVLRAELVLKSLKRPYQTKLVLLQDFLPLVLENTIHKHSLNSIRCKVEEVAVQQNEVGIFAGFDTADAIIQHHRLGAIDRQCF